VAGGGVSLKVCKACMLAKYCSPTCQRSHWPTHKKECKQRAAELHDEALFKDPPAKEECPICFLPMPFNLICCITLPPATITSVPVYNFMMSPNAAALLDRQTKEFYSCCGKSVCKGCVYSFCKSGNMRKCSFCNTEIMSKSCEERVQEMMKRVDANDAWAMCVIAGYYNQGAGGLQQNQERAKDLWTQAAKLGSSQAHFQLGTEYYDGGDLKKAKFHYEAAAMAGHDDARYNLGYIESELGNQSRALKHWKIAASAGNHKAMQNMKVSYNKGLVSRDRMESTLTAYNTQDEK
jgi:hypothetical protein